MMKNPVRAVGRAMTEAEDARRNAPDWYQFWESFYLGNKTTLHAWQTHCEVQHPAPKEDHERCTTCFKLAPIEHIQVWHHTDQGAAEMIARSGFRGDRHGHVYFTTWKTWELGTPGILPKERGAVIEATLPSSFARLDQIITRTGFVELHFRVRPSAIANIR